LLAVPAAAVLAAAGVVALAGGGVSFEHPPAAPRTIPDTAAARRLSVSFISSFLSSS
jgi:hypothetical protein